MDERSGRPVSSADEYLLDDTHHVDFAFIDENSRHNIKIFSRKQESGELRPNSLLKPMRSIELGRSETEVASL